MRDALDSRIRAFVAELLVDPPLAPPFPHAVVIEADLPEDRSIMSQQQMDQKPPSTSTRRSALRIAVAAFVVTVVVAGIAFVLTNGEGDDVAANPGGESVASTTLGLELDAQEGASVLVGRVGTVTGGQGSIPDQIDFDNDGTFRVVDGFQTVHSGLYSVDGDVVTFDVRPEEDDVLWVRNDVQIRNVQHCQEMPGSYTVVFGTESTVTLDVISDPCVTRITAANGLVLELNES